MESVVMVAWLSELLATGTVTRCAASKTNGAIAGDPCRYR
jgi:hypothetical protein